MPKGGFGTVENLDDDSSMHLTQRRYPDGVISVQIRNGGTLVGSHGVVKWTRLRYRFSVTFSRFQGGRGVKRFLLPPLGLTCRAMLGSKVPQ